MLFSKSQAWHVITAPWLSCTAPPTPGMPLPGRPVAARLRLKEVETAVAVAALPTLAKSRNKAPPPWPNWSAVFSSALLSNLQ